MSLEESGSLRVSHINLLRHTKPVFSVKSQCRARIRMDYRVLLAACGPSSVNNSDPSDAWKRDREELMQAANGGRFR